MAMDVYSVPIEQKTYVKHNLFEKPTTQKADSAIGVNLSQDLIYTQIDSSSYFGMTTAATVVLNHWVDVGVFCSYYMPTVKPIYAANAVDSTMFLNSYVFCGNTLAFTVLPEVAVHPKFELDFGFGAATGEYTLDVTTQKFSYPIFILRPAIIMDMNLASFLQWTLGIRYRFQLSTHGPDGAAKLNSKAGWLEISTGPVFNLR